MALWICEECNYGLEARLKPPVCPCCGRRGMLVRVEVEAKNLKEEAFHA